MSHRVDLSRFLREQEIRRAIDSDDVLVELVQHLLQAPDAQLRNIVGETSVTAYRRVHEVLASTFDRALEAIRAHGRFPQAFLTDFARCMILVRYQYARDQISKNLSTALMTIINTLMDRIRSSPGDVTYIFQAISRARTLIDTLAVLVYQLGKKR